MPKLTLLAAAAAAAAMACPASGLAADTYVDPDFGNNANDCTQPLAGGPGVGPCATIAGGIAKAAGAGTVRVDLGDTYSGQVDLTTGVSLLGAEVNPSDTGAAVIDGGAGAGIRILGSEDAGSIANFTIRGDSVGVSVLGSADGISGNTFDDPDGFAGGVTLFGPSDVASNTFKGNGSAAQVAIDTVGQSGITIEGNTIDDYFAGIYAGGASTIRGNTITGVHEAGSTGAGISSYNGVPTIVGNTISDAGSGATQGIAINGFGNESNTGATVLRNRVTGGHTVGIDIRDTGLPTTLDSNAVTGNSTGLLLFDQVAGGNEANAVVSNMTLWDNGIDLSTVGNAITIDSTIVEEPISVSAGATCSITFSRGPTTTPGGSGCQNFQTTADPQLAADNIHLSGLAMVDKGNPATPEPGSLDIDGGPRQVLNLGGCESRPAVRDIGADEANVIVTPSCPAPPKSPVRCKKGKKLKKGKCVKKKRKRKKKK